VSQLSNLDSSRTVRWLRCLGWVGVVFLLLLAASALGFALLTRALGVTHWDVQGLHLNSHSVGLQTLSVVRKDNDGAVKSLETGPLLFEWSESRLRIDHLNLAIHTIKTDSSDEPLGPLNLNQPLAILAWLPDRLDISAFTLSVPCAQGQCTVEGAFAARQAEQQALPLSLELELRHEGRTLQTMALLEGTPEAPRLTANLAIDDQPRLVLRTALTPYGKGVAWSGDLLIPAFHEGPWLLAWINQWWPMPAVTAKSLPGALRIQGDWQLTLPNTIDDIQTLLNAQGSIRLDAHLPQAWPVPGLGSLQGNTRLDASLDKGYLLPRALQADLQLAIGDQPWRLQLPQGIRPNQIHIQAQTPTVFAQTDSMLPLDIAIGAQGESTVRLKGRVSVATQPPWRIQLDEVNLQGTTPKIKQSSIAIQNLNTTLTVHGQADRNSADLTFSNVMLGARQLEVGSGPSATRLDSLSATSPALSLMSHLDDQGEMSFTLKGNTRLKSTRIAHPQLKPTGWQWDGQINVKDQALNLKGKLGADTGLHFRTQLSLASGKPFELEGTLDTLFMRAGNPFTTTFTAWPALLELNTGRLDGQLALRIPQQGNMSIHIGLDTQGLGGVYDRLEMNGLSGKVALDLKGDQLNVSVPAFKADTLNPGFTLGPLELSGTYRARLAEPLAGTLSWQLAQTAILGGRLWIPPGQGSLGDFTLALPLQLSGLQLASLLEAYPTEGLSGEGTIDGQLPLHWTRQGIRVEQGAIGARGPGVLRFRSERISAMGRSNPGMKLVADALDDFHYDVLRSGVDYHEDGTLILSLRLEGRNPDIEKGRAFNFGINLEENIPQLLTSLQLTDRVSDTIQRRVQERLRRNQTAPTTEEKP
jgi:hypothetical protein